MNGYVGIVICDLRKSLHGSVQVVFNGCVVRVLSFIF